MRLFVAVPVLPPLSQALQHVTQPLENVLPNVRWLPEHNWHMTVLFLGDHFTPDQAAEIANAIGQGFSQLSAFEAPVEKIDWFPAHHPVVLAALFTRNLMLQALQDEVFQVLKGIEGVCKPKKRFEPHISLARVLRKKTGFEKKGGDPLPIILEEIGLPVEKVVLYRSHFEPKGVRYEVLAEGRLAPG